MKASLYLPPGAPASKTRPLLEAMRGAGAEVWSIRPADAQNPRVIAALRQRGVKSLPALIAAGTIHEGYERIAAYYAARRAAPRPAAPRPDAAPEYGDEQDSAAQETLEAFYSMEMGAKRRTASDYDIEEDFGE